MYEACHHLRCRSCRQNDGWTGIGKNNRTTLYHGHMDIEPVIEIFGTRVGSAVTRIREVIFDEFAKTDLYGMIFTFMWALDHPEDWEYIDRLVDIFRSKGADIYYVELVASQEVRLQRNATENRLRNKASKRDLEASYSISGGIIS